MPTSEHLPILAGMADVFDALGAPARRAILDVLAERDDQTLFEICGRLAADYKFHAIDTTALRAAMSRWLDDKENPL